ncbi:MAG: hypothetical protein OEL75_02200, partial [Kiritimatiellaceae bacterium]|nr:hypothetical protein [Kiritimatiellaceae bacterium]
RGEPRRDRRDGPPRSDRRSPPRRDNDRAPRRDDGRAPRRDFVPRPQRVDLPVIIKFLPEQKRLASLVRQVHHSKRAYPLIDLAHIFLSDPRGHMVKLEVEPGAKGFKLYQGKRSKMVATDRETLLRQLIDDHIEDFFTKEEIVVDPPSGVFPMIGKIEDILIGPPNHHSYNERLIEIHRSRYAGMPFDRFKEKVQTVRDEELIEQWKQEASQKTVYRLKEGDKECTLVQAEEYIRTQIADLEIEEVTRAVLPSSLARKIRDYNLIRMVREAWQQESRFPISLAFALRAAFRHLHLYTFKAGKNINFVTAVHPDPIAPDAAVETIRCVLEFLADHPGSTRQQLVEGLRPGAEKDSAEAHEILNPIRWLVEKGHIIEFFNGTLSVPSRRSRR